MLAFQEGAGGANNEMDSIAIIGLVFGKVNNGQSWLQARGTDNNTDGGNQQKGPSNP